MAHFCTPKSINAHSSWICNDWRLFEIAARSSAYAVELIVNLDVPNVYPFCSLCNQRCSGSKNIRNKYGLRVSLWMVHVCIGIDFVFPKCSPMNIVVDWEYIFLTRITASVGYFRSFIMARSLA